MANADVRMSVRFVDSVSVFFFSYVNGNDDELAVADTALGDDVLCQVADIGNLTPQEGDLQARVMIEMNMHGRY